MPVSRVEGRGISLPVKVIDSCDKSREKFRGQKCLLARMGHTEQFEGHGSGHQRNGVQLARI